MAEEVLGARVRDPRRRQRPRSSPTTRTRRRRRSPARGHELAQIWMHNGMLQMGEEKMAKSRRQHRRCSATCSTRSGRDALVWFFADGHYRQPLAFTRERLGRRGAPAWSGSARRGAGSCRATSPEALAPHRDAFFDALADDFNTPRALAALAEWIREANRSDAPVGDAHLREMLGVLGLENLLDADDAAPAGGRRAGRAPRRGRARGARLRGGRPAARRAARRAAGRCATARGPSSSPRASARARRRRVGRDRLRPQRRPRGAPRAAAASAPVWATKGAAKEFPARGARDAPTRSRAAPAPTAHQGVCADVEEYRYADAGRAAARARTRCSSRSTRSPTRRTSARSAGRPSARARRA